MFNNKFIKYGIFFSGIFVLAIIVWYSPVLFKGYPAYTISPNTLLARNLALTDSFSLENDLNILLSTDLIKEQGQLSNYGNKFTSFAYAEIFKVIRFLGENNFILLSIIIHALTLLIFTLTVLYLFNFKIAGIFSLIYIFIPFNWVLPYGPGSYEFALLFCSLFFMFYFLGNKEKQKPLFLIFSGLFLALAGLSKETFLLIAPFLFFYLLFYKKRTALVYIFVFFIAIFGAFWLPSALENTNIKLLFMNVPEQVKSSDFASYGHLFPDPYTYHFEQKEFLADLQNKIDNNKIALMMELDRIKELRNAGEREISLFDRARIGLVIGSRHVFRFISLEDIGGPFIFLLILLGLYSLRQKNRYLYQFFVYWVFSAVFLMSFVVLVGRNHLMDFNWAIALLISLGLIFLVKLINNYFDLKKKKQVFLYIVLLFVVVYHFISVNHVVWSRIYDNSNNLIVNAYSQEIKKINIANKDVIAIGLDSGSMYNLNYLTDRSMIIFRSETVKDLLEENKLDWAFEQFGVKYVLGYSDELSEEIISQADVINIASDSLEPVAIEISRNKGWLMNLVK